LCPILTAIGFLLRLFELFAIDFNLAIAVQGQRELFGKQIRKRNRLLCCAGMLDAEM
jgi:hypothetical protein